MNQRINYSKAAPKAIKGIMEMEKYAASILETPLIELVKLRASQLNGCAYCIDMHTKDARAAGETEQRLYTLSVWRETTFFSDREKAALEWTEVLTLISQNDVPDVLFTAVRDHFGEEELIALSICINAINSWNRLAIGFRTPVGTYQPAKQIK